MSDGPASGGVQRVRVDRDDVGRRLDNYLLSRFKGLPRSRVYRMIRGGEVRVNGGRARPDRAFPPPRRAAAESERTGRTTNA